MSYVDGYVLPLPKKNLDAYRRMAKKASRIWRKNGALEVRECVGDDLKTSMGLPFGGTVKLKPGETVVFSWIVYKNRKHRDQVNAKVLKDPWIASTDIAKMPFDMKRMVYGGFKTIVED